jgi:hypothetical protein
VNVRAVVVVVAIALAAQAHANTPDEEETPGPVSSYRGEVLGADALAFGISFAALSSGSGDVLIFAVPTYLLIAPAMHVSNDRSGHALTSFMMRVFLPASGFVLGNAIGKKLDEPCTAPCDSVHGGPGREAYIGFLGGLVTASLLDAIFLAKGDEPPKSRPSVTPVAAPMQGGLAVGVAGQF